MANHVRQQIREAMAAELTGLATTGSRVFQSRVYPLSDNELPCLLISNGNNGGVEYASVGYPRLVKRTTVVEVKAVAKLTVNLDDLLDTMCNEVEKAVFANLTLGGLAKDIRLSAEPTTEMVGDGEKPVGVCTIQIEVDYYVNETAPDVAL